MSLSEIEVFDYIKRWHEVGINCLYPCCKLWDENTTLSSDSYQQWDCFVVEKKTETYRVTYLGRDDNFIFCPNGIPLNKETDLIIPSTMFEYYDTLSLQYESIEVKIF